MAENKPTNRERLREITDGIEQGIKELFESEKYMRYLSVMSRFHRYSVNNTMLLYMQKRAHGHTAQADGLHDQLDGDQQCQPGESTKIVVFHSVFLLLPFRPYVGYGANLPALCGINFVDTDFRHACQGIVRGQNLSPADRRATVSTLLTATEVSSIRL